MMLYKYIIKNVAKQARQDGDLHAQAALWRQRHRACTRINRLWKKGKPLFAGKEYAGLEPDGALLHWRDS